MRAGLLRHLAQGGLPRRRSPVVDPPLRQRPDARLAGPPGGSPRPPSGRRSRRTSTPPAENSRRITPPDLSLGDCRFSDTLAPLALTSVECQPQAQTLSQRWRSCNESTAAWRPPDRRGPRGRGDDGQRHRPAGHGEGEAAARQASSPSARAPATRMASTSPSISKRATRSSSASTAGPRSSSASTMS